MRAAVVAVTAAGVLAAGCGGTEAFDPTPVKTFKITPAASGQPTAVPTPSPEATEPAAGTPGAATEITIQGVSSTFDPEEVSAPAGLITIIFDNRDAGVVHNIHVYRGDDNDGEDMGQTELEAGRIEQRLDLTLTPDSYYYVCDVHPTTMEGTLTVS
jgi:plastocyanin